MSDEIQEEEVAIEEAPVKKTGTLSRARERFEDNALQAIQTNPRYFVWWYTFKSLALVAAFGTATYYIGKSRGLREGSIWRGRTGA